ncbi:MAG: tape measure protein [Nitrospiraceae bacterium]
MTAAMRRVRAGLNATERQARKTKKSMFSLNAMMGIVGVSAAILAGKAFVKMGSEMEQLRSKIAVFERGFENVDGVMAKLNDQFGKTPFALATVGNAFVRLKASGLDPLDGSLQALIDGVAAFGGGAQELQRAGIAIQQMAGKGVISMEELRQQLGEAIPFAMRVMAMQMQISVGELIKQVERGELAAKEGLTALFGGLAATFGGVAAAMVNTMAGSMEALKKTMQQGADTIFNTFDFAPKIAATLNVIGEHIKAMFAGLTKEDTERMQAFFVEIAFLLVNLTKAALELALMLADFLLPVIHKFNSAMTNMELAVTFMTEGFGLGEKSAREIVQEFNKGITSVHGFRKSIELLTVKGMQELADAMRQVQAVQDKLSLSPANLKLSGAMVKSLASMQASIDAVNTLPFEQKISRLNDKVSEFGKGLENEAARLAGLAKELDAALVKGGGKSTDAVKSLRIQMTSLGQAIGEGHDQIAEFNGKITELRAGLQSNFIDKMTVSIDKLSLKVADMNSAIAGTRMQKAVGEVIKRFGGVRIELQKQLDLAERLPIHDEERADIIARIGVLLKENLITEDRAIVIAKQRVQMEQAMFAAKERALRATQAFATSESQIELDRLRDPTSGFFDTGMADQVRATKEALREQVVEIELAAQATQDLIDTEMNPERRATLQARLDLMRQQVPILQQIAEETTVSALLQRELWTEVGRTIRETLGAALKDLIKGTGSVKDVLVNMFDRITDAAADYLVQLLLIKAASGGLFGGVGGGGFGGLLGFQNGGAFKGSVKPFANGDIVKGPTLFGLAGEAGTEAIMPLTRIGGKLGVASTGGGGDTLHLTVQAIDNQTGTKFLLDNLSTIQGGIQEQKALNGTGR